MSKKLKIIKKISSGYIEQSFVDRSALYKGQPHKGLTLSITRKSGRDKTGQITVRHRGGGQKIKYRVVSTLDQNLNKKAKVLRLEYDPNRTAFIALVELEDKEKLYILAVEGLKVNDVVIASEKVKSEPGNRSVLKSLPIGAQICDIQIYPDSKKYMVRAAGSSATLMAVDGDYALIKLPSGELRKIHSNCYATIGRVSNPDHSNIRIGKAGRKRLMGVRPTVRGKAMHPAAHPHGGGEGVNPIGLKHPKTPWGKPAMGRRTRRRKRSNKFIVKRAKEK
ncbi:MAG: 50S ribosomal protein L2 [Candidatus Berkelbacteria bacterium]|nr:50S ribosomal protein L2 [Candidatus Berkelbacteria bacterium]